MESKDTCINCRWFDRSQVEDDGMCRVNPPVNWGTMSDKDEMPPDYGVWPWVTSEDWCGKFSKSDDNKEQS